MVDAREEQIIKKYLSNDKVLNEISKNFLTLDPKDVRLTNVHIKEACEQLINLMKSHDQLFAKVYQKIEWTGSFYKRTKVGSPDEFDLNLVLKLPFEEQNIQFISNYAGYTKIRVVNMETDKLFTPFRERNKDGYSLMKSFIDNSSANGGFLNQEKFRRWIESIFSRTVKIRKAGPAFTMYLSISGQKDPISIDLVPVLAFSNSHLPFCSNKNTIKKYPRNWFVVPKPLTNNSYGEDLNHYWRISFYMHEKDMLLTQKKVKPIIRLLKKFRDTHNWKSIASYYIETLCFHNLNILNDKVPITTLFFEMLKKLHEAFLRHEIKFYWNTRLNLLERITFREMNNKERALFKIIQEIEKKIIRDRNDSLIIARYILTSKELSKLEKILINGQSVPNLLLNDGRQMPSTFRTEESELEPDSLLEDANKWQCTIV